MADTLVLEDEGAIRAALKTLRGSTEGGRFVELRYQGGGVSPKLALTHEGGGGLAAVKERLADDDVAYVVMEVVVQNEDSYNSVKYMLVTWIGPKVPAGLTKARCAGHRPQLVELVSSELAVAAEFQPFGQGDMTEAVVAAKVTRIAKQDAATTTEVAARHTASTADVKTGAGGAADKKLDSLSLEDIDAIDAAFKLVHTGGARWAALTYAGGSKDRLVLVGTGDDLPSLGADLPEADIYYALVSVTAKDVTCSQEKFLLATCVGPRTSPIKKARSAAHRTELAGHIMSFAPFHSHFPVTSGEDLTDEALLAQLG